MTDRIGKYEIVERIGRGGMGTVYKAKDSRLNRLVAVKIVSPEVEVSDDLRARFFAEAQACAGLSHPNIVTIYDSGEEDERLYIVMELLDGQELKRLIADRVQLPIEEKVALMIQLCDALSYAHDKGVIHRDIKPGNIFFQRSGPVKIIDFGIAKMATSSSMTRTGLIMGTLRYMSPEQVRGKADQRSDQFSLSAVFYEMLSYRPPYLGEDPIHLLEQLRTEDPPSLLELDPSLPPELARVVERGMQKAPELRYPSLREMRDDLEVVERQLRDQQERLRAELTALVAEVRDADASVARRLGGDPFDAPLSIPDTTMRLGVLQEHIGKAKERLGALADYSRKLEAADRILQHGRDLLKAEKFAQAIADFEAVAAELPMHAEARGLLEEAVQGEALRVRCEKCSKLLEEAARALDDKDPIRSLALVQNAADLPAPPEAADQIAALRRAAKTLQAEQEAVRRARQQAELAREQVVEAKKRAEDLDARGYCGAEWSAAGAKLEEADQRFKDEKFSEALLGYDRAIDAYASAEELARDRKREERRAADEAKAAERLQLARKLLDEAQGEFSNRAYVRCQEILQQVEQIPPPDQLREEFRSLGENAETALQNERRSRKPAQQARMLMTAARVDAQAEGAVDRAPGSWAEAEASAAAGAAAFVRELFAEAHELFEAATASFRRALEEAQAAEAAPAGSGVDAPEGAPGGDPKRRRAEHAKNLVEEALRSATLQGHPKVAPKTWAELEARLKSADAAFGRGDDEAAFVDYEAALLLCQRFEDEARAVTGTRPAQRQRAIARAATSVTKAPSPDTKAPSPDTKAPSPQTTSSTPRDARAEDATVFVPLPARPADTAGTKPPSRNLAETPTTPPTAREHVERKRGNPFAYAMVGVAVLAAVAAWLVAPSSREEWETVDVSVERGAAAPAGTEAESAPPVVADATTTSQAKMAAEMKAAAEEKAGIEARAAQARADASGKAATGDTAGAQAQADADAKAAAQAKADADAKAAAQSQADADAKAAAQAKADADAKAAAQAKADADAKAAAQAKADADAKAAAQAKADADAKAAAQAKADADAKAAAQAKADADAKAAAQAKADAEAKAAAQAKADADAKAAALAKADTGAAKGDAVKAADAKAAARAKADAEKAAASAEAAKKQKEIELARAKAVPPAAASPAKSLVSGAYAVVFTEGTDGKRGGGAWGACWRNEISAARACARDGCEKTRQSGQPCKEAASTAPGGHCAVARASGYGITAGVCSDDRAAAESGAIAGCASQLRRNYGNVEASCKVIWSTVR